MKYDIIILGRGQDGWWIGGSDYTVEGEYRWIQTGGIIGPFTKWGVAQPDDNNKENCMALLWTAEQLWWHDEPCQRYRAHIGSHYVYQGVHHFICQMK